MLNQKYFENVVILPPERKKMVVNLYIHNMFYNLQGYLIKVLNDRIIHDLMIVFLLFPFYFQVV